MLTRVWLRDERGRETRITIAQDNTVSCRQLQHALTGLSGLYFEPILRRGRHVQRGFQMVKRPDHEVRADCRHSVLV